jgi:hypothetical protein
VAGGLFATHGMLPENLSNVYRPGFNAQQMYAGAAFSGLAGAFGTSDQAAYAAGSGCVVFSE